MADASSISWLGDRCLRLSFAHLPTPEAALQSVHAAWRRLSAPPHRPPGLLDLTPAYNTLLLTFDPVTLDHAAAERATREALDSPTTAAEQRPSQLIEVPVCYEADFAPDLASLATLHKLAPAEVVSLHAAAEYTVAFIGFSPGFPYLTGLPSELHTPRHAQPRTRVAAGSVGIAGDQAGIYPQATPGGWQIIGRTPLRLFDVDRIPAALFSPSDHVKFVPISTEQFNRLSASSQGGT